MYPMLIVRTVQSDSGGAGEEMCAKLEYTYVLIIIMLYRE